MDREVLKKELIETFDDYIKAYFNERDFDKIQTFLDEEMIVFGTEADEIAIIPEQVKKLYHRDIKQIKNPIELTFNYKNIELLSPSIGLVLAVVNLKLNLDEGCLDIENLRISMTFIRNDKKWKIRQQHLSFPASEVPTGESYPIIEMEKRNKCLEEKINEKIKELLETNKFLENEIKERMFIEQALKLSEEKYKLLVENVQDAIIIVQNYRIVFFNKRLLEISGYQSDDIYNEKFKYFIFEDDCDLVEKNYTERLIKNDIVPRYQFRILKKDKSIHWVEIVGIKIEWKNEPAILSFIKDINDQKIAENELIILNENLRSSKELLHLNFIQKSKLVEELTHIKEELEVTNSTKDKFFSIIAHDLRSPFQGFIGLTDYIEKNIDDFTKDEIVESIKNINNKSQSLYLLLKNLLEWSAVQRGSMTFVAANENIVDLLKQVINAIKPVAEEKEIQIEFNAMENLNCNLDRNMMMSVIQNLLSNAIKFTNRKGKVKIDLYINANDQIEVKVSDTGIGIKTEIMDKLFKIEEKTGSLGTEGEESTGLGLLLCKDFIELHNGKIWVESEEDKGTSFYFTIPK